MRERSSTNSQINPFTSNLTVPRDEREPRKRISAEAGSIDSIGWLAKIRKLNQQSNPPKTAIRVTPLRPVCLLHPMYYQDEEKDYKAPEFPQVIKEFCADISVDLSTIEWKNYETVEKLLKECDEEKFAKFMNSQFYKTVWHSSALDDSAGKVKYTVPFTTDLANIIPKLKFDMFYSFKYCHCNLK
uniref:Uncharacterized protein n=1 Tax=Caenorhabditis elegans TaxID=6239 RepID=Q22764_CAEEL|eukprot:NP_509529.1 Uncharacterized protein CELE_T25B6.1 [Caenorhabditis elegans]